MARVMFAVLLMMTALLQATFFPALGLLGIVPDFALVLLLVWSATHGAFEGMFWAFGLGLWVDLLTLDPLGTHVLALLVVAALGGAIRGRLFRSGAVFPIVAVLAATLAANIVTLFVSLAGGEPVGIVSAIRLAVMTSLLNALLVPVVYGALLVVDRWMPHYV